jgi:type IV secretory pathway VirB10-like protein
MPIRDEDEYEEQQADAGLLEFIDRRRDHQARERRQRVLVAAIAALAVIAIALAFSNMVLLRRLAGRPESTPAASAPIAPPVASAPTPAGSPPTASEPHTPSVASAPTPAGPPPTASEPNPPQVASTPTPSPAVPDTTARRAERALPSAPAAGMVVERSTPAPSTARAPRSRGAGDDESARRTARWLVETHGRAEAESRVAKVAEFYGGAEGAFWRRVLVNVRQEPER